MAKGTFLGRGPGFLGLSQKTAEQTASALSRGCSRRPGWLGPGPRAAFEKRPCPGSLWAPRSLGQGHVAQLSGRDRQEAGATFLI